MSAGKHMRMRPGEGQAGQRRTRRLRGDARSGTLKRRLRDRAVMALAVLLVIVGIAIMAAPPVAQWLYARQSEAGAEQFERQSEELRSGDAGRLADLLTAMRQYNQRLDDEGQAGLRDAWSYEQPSFQLADWGIDSEVAGYLRIPRMGETLPIYLGATEENMSKGAVQLSQTSLPVGSWHGSSNNTVIAAHRNHWSAGMFHDIDRLQVGDPVYVENLWGTLEYRVVETRVITPDDIDAVKIQPGKDMLTLVSCHPLYHNYQRYVVYCELVHSDMPE